MRSRSWLVLGILTFPAAAYAQTVTEADVIGAWRAEVEHADSEGRALGAEAWLVLWPDSLWWYGGALMRHGHGGARWRLVGDTLWLGNDYKPYFHGMITGRILNTNQKGYGLAVMDTAIIKATRPTPFEVPDSIYWSKDFRDSADECSGDYPCGTWVYQVTKRGQQLHLVRLDSLSRSTASVAGKAILTRDTLLHCEWISGDCHP